MHIISMLLLPVLFLLFGVSAVQCVPTFEHEDPTTGQSLTCNQCPPGTYMAANCTNTTQTKCLPCKSQHFTEVWNYMPKCLYCCSGNQEVETECSATTNRVCRCKEGFYLINDFCMRHSECGIGHGVKTTAPLTGAVPALWCLCAVQCVPTFEHEDPTTGQSLTCNQCPPGTYMAAYCTATTQTECLPCKSQHFTEVWNYMPKCLYCDNFCIENQEVETECSATTNRVCRCKEGFYLINDFCMRHSECGIGHGVKTKGTPQTNTVCESCSEGYFSTSSSALESCAKHQDCASGQIALLPGTVFQDKMCGSCVDLANGGETLRSFATGFFSMHRMRASKMKTFVSRYIHKSAGGTVAKQRDPLMDQIKSWLTQAPESQLRSLPQMLKASQLRSMAEKLENIVNSIEQQSPNCTLSFVV